MRAVGSVLEKVVVSNLLNSENIAPRVYDLIILQNNKNAFHFALVVQHIDGPIVYGEDGIKFVNLFKNILNKFGITTVSISDHCDLRPPYFRDNIVKNSFGQLYYVDIQNFVFKNLSIRKIVGNDVKAHFKNDPLTYLIDSERFSFKNKKSRNLIGITSTLESLFNNACISLNECVVLDITNGLGIFGVCLLSIGALWDFCLSDKNQSNLLKRFYQLNGFTRFDTVENINIFIDFIGKYKFDDKKIVVICDSCTVENVRNSILNYECLLFVDLSDSVKDKFDCFVDLKYKKKMTESILLDKKLSISFAILIK